MTISARSILMAGVATLTVTAVAAAPTVQPSPRSEPTVQLTANVQQQLPQQPPLLTLLLNSPQALLGPAAPLGTLPPAPAPLAIPIAPNLANTIDNIYIAVEPWVRYGFEVATSIVRWIPYVGWFAGQIMVFYNFGESMVASGVFNFTDWLRGNGGIAENLVDFGVDVGLAFVWLGLDELAQFVPLPPIPLPPRPPLQGPFLAAATLMGPTAAPEVGVQNVASDLVNAVYYPVRNTIDYGVSVFQDVLAPIPVVRIVGDQTELLWDNLVRPISDSVVLGAIDPILNAPLNINSYINGAYTVGATTVNSLINTGFAEANYFLGGLPFTASTQESQLNRTAEVTSVPSIVKNTLAPQTKVDETPRPLAEVAKTVRNVRNEIRAGFTGHDTSDVKQVSDAADAGGNTVVRTRGEAGGPLTKVISDITKGSRSSKSDNVAAEVANAPRSIVKSLSDTAKKVVNGVRKAAKDAGDAAKDRPAADAAE